MKHFDALSRGKKPNPSLGGDGISVKNNGTKIHHDIDLREKKISLLSKKSSEYKTHTPKKGGAGIYQCIIKFFHSSRQLSRLQVVMMVVIFAMAYMIYGLGFVLRTEHNIRQWMSGSQAEIINDFDRKLAVLWRDYQVVGFLAENSFMPLEPIASYGKVLAGARKIAEPISAIIDLQASMLEWTKKSQIESVLPIMESLWQHLTTIGNIMTDIQKPTEILVGQTSHNELIGNYLDQFQSIIGNRDIWYTILGSQGPTRILILNQNSDELRAGGGFPGTAFILEFDQGKLIEWKFTDIYALDWQLRGYRPSPEGINRLKSIDYPGQPVEFEIRDANYFPLFSQSAAKIDELAQIAGIGKIDLVIGINQKILEDIVQLVEPLIIEGIPTPLDHKNINSILSMLVEAKKSIKDTPKTTVNIIGQKLFEKIHLQDKEKVALAKIVQHLLTGEIVAGSPRSDIQKALDEGGLFDTWKTETRDWVYPIFTSLSKNKSDRFMERTFTVIHTASCERRVELTQKHWFDIIEEARVKKYAQELGIVENLSTLFFIQGDGDNVQYIRFIVPPGSQLVSATGVEQPRKAENTSLYTVLDGYKTTQPNTTSTMSFTYVIPQKYCGNETYFYKQPGLRNTRFVVKKGETILYQKFYE